VKHSTTKSSGDKLLASDWNAEHVLTSGLDADKPTSGLLMGQLYWATDTKILYRATSSTTWEEILRGETVTRLAQLSERAHSSLTGIGENDHHQKFTQSDHDTLDHDAKLLKIRGGDTVRNSNDAFKYTTSSTYTKVKETKLDERFYGAMKILFKLRITDSAYTAYGRIYKNGSAWGQERSTTSTTYVEFSEILNLDEDSGTLIQIYAKQSGGGWAYVRDFRFAYDFDPTHNVTNQDP